MLIILLVCLTIPILLLAVPVDVTVSVQRSGSISGRVIVAWLFGRVRLSSKTDRKKTPEPKAEAPEPETSEPPEPKSPSKTSHRQTLSDAMTIIKTRGFVKRIIKLFRDLVTRIRIRTLTVSGRIGLGDPADTGRFWGMLSIVTGFLAMVREAVILLEPDFEQAVFEFDGQGSFRIIPLQMCLVMALFLLSPPALRAGWHGLKIGLRIRRERKRENSGIDTSPIQQETKR